MRSRKAIKRWPVTVYESSRFITVKAPKDPWTITRISIYESVLGNQLGISFFQIIERANLKRINIPTRKASRR